MESISNSNIQLKQLKTVVETEAICHDSSLNRKRMNSNFDFLYPNNNDSKLSNWLALLLRYDSYSYDFIYKCVNSFISSLQVCFQEEDYIEKLISKRLSDLFL